MLKLLSFGSGSSGNCYYLCNEDENEAILIDAGVGIRKMKKFVKDYNINMSIVKGLILTHDHADHIKCAEALTRELKIFAYTTGKIHKAISTNSHNIKPIDPANAIIIEKGVEFAISSFRITAFPIPHDSTENVGYEIQVGGKVFTIMTDVGMPTDIIKEHIRKANYLVIEANYDSEMLHNGPYPQHLKERICSGTGHLSNMQTANLLLENIHPGLTHVWLCHLSQENNHPELARKTIEFQMKAFGIIPGADFFFDVLRRTIPSGPYQLE